MGDLRKIVADAADASADLFDTDNDELSVDPEWAAVMAGAAAALRAMASEWEEQARITADLTGKAFLVRDDQRRAAMLRAAAHELEATR